MSSPPPAQITHNLTYGSIVAEDSEELTPHHFAQLVPLAQCCLDYALFHASASGIVLVSSVNKCGCVSVGSWHSQVWIHVNVIRYRRLNHARQYHLVHFMAR